MIYARLTEKIADGYQINMSHGDSFLKSAMSLVVDKLGKIEDLEDRFGIDIIAFIPLLEKVLDDMTLRRNVYDTSIADLHLSKRTHNILYKYDFRTVGDLLNSDLKIRGLGNKAIREIKKSLEGLGVLL